MRSLTEFNEYISDIVYIAMKGCVSKASADPLMIIEPKHFKEAAAELKRLGVTEFKKRYLT